jgi:hypothetical protein
MIITNSETIISKFGYWPNFCDARILECNFNINNNEIMLVLHYIDTDKKLDLTLGLFFIDVRDVLLHDFMDENVIDELFIDERDKEAIKVVLDSCYGLNGSFNCKSIKVMSAIIN